MRKIRLEKPIQNLEENTLYISKIHSENENYLCTTRFVTVGENLETSLRTLQKGIREFGEETDDELIARKICDRLINDFLENGIYGRAVEKDGNEIFNAVYIKHEDGKFYSYYDTI